MTDQADMEARADWHYIDMFRTLKGCRTNIERAKAASLYVAQAEAAARKEERAAAYHRAAEVARDLAEDMRQEEVNEEMVGVAILHSCSAKTADKLATAILSLKEGKG